MPKTLLTNSTCTDITASLSLPISTYISCVEVQKNDENHILITLSNYGIPNKVFETTDGGNTWTSVQGSLTSYDIPIRWAMFDPNNPDRALLATELGVFATTNLNGGQTQWFPVNPGTSNTRIDMLVRRPLDNMVIAATHGRGLFMVDIFAPHADFTTSNTILYRTSTGQKTAINLVDLSVGAVSWAWDFNNDGTTDSNVQNPQGVCYYGTTIKLTITTATGTTYIKTRNPIFNLVQSCIGCCPGKKEDEVSNPIKELSVSPNPFSDHASISYSITEKSIVSIQVYNLQGKMVRQVINLREQEAGIYTQSLDREGLEHGMYLCTIQIGDKRMTKKIIIQ